jgi:uncharacterized membrane protein YvbJ
MKTCPNCGSVLADNEPYCENCGFDPDFDIAFTSQPKTVRKPNYQKNNGNSEPSPLDVAAGLFVIATLIFCAWMILDANNWNIVYIITSNIDTILSIPIAIIIFGPILYFINQL